MLESQIMRKLLAVLAFLSLAGCGGSDGPTAPVIPPVVIPVVTPTGTWTGTVGTQVLTLVLVQNAANVNGTGTLTNTPTGTRSYSVTGTYTAPVLDVTIAGSGSPFALHAVLTEKRMTGDLQGSGFTGEVITLTKP